MTVAGRRAGKAGRPGAGRLGRGRALPAVSWALGHPAAPLALVALLYGLAQLAFVGPGLRWGWDELVYLSQVSPRLPDAAFTAPRARGITWLAAPVAFFSASHSVVRLWMTLLSSAGLFLAYLPWLSVLAHRGRSAVVAMAALLFAALWVTQYYGGAVMPNLYVAYASVAATAFFLLAVRGGAVRDGAVGDGAVRDGAVRDGAVRDGAVRDGAVRDGAVRDGAVRDGATHDPVPVTYPYPYQRAARGPLAGLALSVAAAALLRPGDAVWLVLALGLAWSAVREWRRRDVILAVAGGLGLGLAQWVAEAFMRYGGLLHRIEEASRIQGRLRPTWGFVHEFAALNGPLLCRPCTISIRYPYLAFWWLALPFAAAGGLLVSRRLGLVRPYALACVAGVGLAAQYLFLVGYGAPRFLLPAYAVLALPVALLLYRIASSRRMAAVLIVIGVAGQLVVGGPAGTLPMAYEAGCAFRVFRRTALTRPDGRMAAYVTHVPEPEVAGWGSRRLLTPEGRVWYLWLRAMRPGDEETARPRPRGFAGSVPRVGFEPTLYGF
jgi:hypothetical protein